MRRSSEATAVVLGLWVIGLCEPPRAAATARDHARLAVDLEILPVYDLPPPPDLGVELARAGDVCAIDIARPMFYEIECSGSASWPGSGEPSDDLGGPEDVVADRGYASALAADARAGLDLVRRHAPAILLLDLDRPATGGPEARPEIKAIDPEIPVIILTADSGNAAPGPAGSPGPGE